jgi:sarcosine oxidase subunit alpha
MAHGRRTRSLSHRVILTLDGDPVEAERGEPVAAALLAAGHRTIARSPKFHRPRGPACMRGACDGCLARVNEAPNTMTCMLPAEDGMVVVSQNRLGPREVDLLRMTDWFFPEGMNHHELFAGVPGIQTIMQGFARRVAGLGRLPTTPEAPRRAVRRHVDVLVVGAGPSGMAVASRLARAGRKVEVVDDQLVAGGGIAALAAEEAARFDGIRAPFAAAVKSGQIRLRLRTTAGAIYGHDVLLAGEEGAEVAEAEALVLAPGAHDSALAFEGNDVPGVMSARAAGFLLNHGVLAGERACVVVPEGGGPFGEAYAHAASAFSTVEVVFGDPISVKGASTVKGVRIRTPDGKERSLSVDAVLIDAPRSPAYELCQQAGATLAHDLPRGFVVVTHDGRIAADGGIWAVGEVSGVPFEPRAIDANAAAVAEQIAQRKSTR